MFATSFTVIGAIIYGILVLICWYREYCQDQIRQAEREERRRQQQREWIEQFNVLSPTIRAAIRMVREDRREALMIAALLRHYNFGHKSGTEEKEIVDWKKEGF